MPQFPITRTKRLPPAVGPGVRAALDVRTGLPAVGRALSEAGGALAGLGLEMLDRRNAIEAKRQQMEDSRAFAFANAAIKDARIRHGAFRDATPDTRLWEPNRKELFDAARAAIISRPQSDDHRSLMVAKMAAEDTTSTALTFAAAVRRERQDTNDAMDFDLELALVSGDKLQIKSSLARWKAHWSGEVDEAEARIRLAAILERSEKKRENIVAESVLTAALALPFDEGVEHINSTDLPMARKVSLIDKLRQQQKHVAQTMATELVFELEKIQRSKLSPIEREAQLNGLIERLGQIPGLSPAEARTSIDRVRAVQRGGDIKTDKLVFAQVMSKIRKLTADSLPETIVEARQFIFDNQINLSTVDFGSALRSLDTLLAKDKTKAIDTVVELAIQRGQITEGFDDADVTRQLQKKANDNPDMTAKELFVFGKELTADYTKTPPQIFTQAHIQKRLGELTVKSWIDNFGRARIIRRGSDAIAHITKNLGPNWQRVAPEAVEIIKRNWPNAVIPKLDAIPAPPEGVPPDAKWDANRQMWTWVRDGRLKGFSGGGE